MQSSTTGHGFDPYSQGDGPGNSYQAQSSAQAQSTHGRGGRALPLLGAAALGYLGGRRGGLLGTGMMVLGGLLAYRSATGRLDMQDISRGAGALGRQFTHGQAWSKPVHVVQSVTINKPREELYRFWRDFQNLPRFMAHLKEITILSERRSHWVAKAPAGYSVAWDAEISEDIEGERIAWHSVEGADVENAGSVVFKDAPGGRGTEVKVEMRYTPPGGQIGRMVAKIFHEEPEQQVRGDLRRFKQIMEASEVSVAHGEQSDHPRSVADSWGGA